MTHDELLAKIDDSTDGLKHEYLFPLLLANTKALQAVVKLHQPNEQLRCACSQIYPCRIIQAIEKELNK